MKQLIEISTSTILKIVAVILALVFLYLVKNVLVILFLALILSAAAETPVEWLMRYKVRRGLAVAMVYIVGIALFALIIYLIAPPLATQIKAIARDLPDYLFRFESKVEVLGVGIGFENLQELLLALGNRLSASAGDIFAGVINFFGGLFSALMILVISIYLVIDEKGIKKFVVSLVSPGQEEYAANLVDRIMFKLGAWFRGQLVLMFAIGLMTYIGLTLMNVEFALTLALIAGLLEIVPIIGPILAAVPAILFVLPQSLGLAVLVAALYYVVQELEKYLIVPLVMKKAVGLNPLAIIVSVLVGFEVYGIIGAILAIPVAAIISIGFSDLMERKKTMTAAKE